jgi:hypothetical protein
MQHEKERHFRTTRTSPEFLVRLKENERLNETLCEVVRKSAGIVWLMIGITKRNCAHDKEGLAFHSRDTNNMQH